MTSKLDRFIKMIEDGVIITDVTLFNSARADLDSIIEDGEKFQARVKSMSKIVGTSFDEAKKFISDIDDSTVKV